MGVMRVYKDYYPEIVVGEATRGKASAFKVSLAASLSVDLYAHACSTRILDGVNG
jgi:hypothetical protein